MPVGYMMEFKKWAKAAGIRAIKTLDLGNEKK